MVLFASGPSRSATASSNNRYDLTCIATLSLWLAHTCVFLFSCLARLIDQSWAKLSTL